MTPRITQSVGHRAIAPRGSLYVRGWSPACACFAWVRSVRPSSMRGASAGGPPFRLAAALGALLWAGVTALGATPFGGPFALDDGVTFYLHNPAGSAFELDLTLRQPFRDQAPQPTLIRVLDPRENLVQRRELPGDLTANPRPEKLRLSVAAAGAGVYQVIVHGGRSASYAQSSVALATTPALAFGVFGHLQWLTGQGDQFSDTYVYLPPGLRRLPVETGPAPQSLVLSDDQGVERLRLEPGRTAGAVELPASGDQVWRLQVRGDYYRLDFKGYPIILCPSPEVARAIHASVDVMPDGTLCFHKHQAAAWQLLQEYRAKPAGEYAVRVRPLEDFAHAYRQEPGRNTLLFGHYGVVSVLPALLAQQNLDPPSPWFGSIFTWKDRDGRERPNPLTDYDRLGEEAFAALGKDLAALYWLDAPFNPYYRDPALLNRVVVGALLDQLVMREGEFCSPSNTYYWGTHAFVLCHSHSGAFSLVFREVPPPVQSVWRAGQQRLTDRFLYGTVGGCTNQWTVLLAGLWRYVEGTGEQEYRQAVLRNAGWLTSGAMGGTGLRPAGYMTEALGPDATYNGISGHYLSELYHASEDPAILDAQRRSYDLFNHTIVPEPDGTWLGSSGFCHRTPGDWVSPQYGAGLGPMARVLPEAGLRFPGHGPWAYYEPFVDEPGRIRAEQDLGARMAYFGEDYLDLEPANYSRASGAFDIMFTNWRTYANDYRRARLPVLAHDTFTRDFGGEFLCVRRPAYYAFLYGGVAYQEWQMASRPADYREQYPHNDGLCLFWSPGFGVSLLSQNWGASRANTLLVRSADGAVLWPYYLDTGTRLDAAAGTAHLTGKIRGTPLTYVRRYRFLDDGVECRLEVTAGAACAYEAVQECIPYPLADLKPGMSVALQDSNGWAVPSGGAAARLVFALPTGATHTIVFAQPVSIDLGAETTVDHYGGSHDYGRALVHLPRRWEAGQTVVLQYALQPSATATAVRGDPLAASAPLRLSRPSPNPFNSRTVIPFAAGGEARLDVVDLLGRHVRSLAAPGRPGGARVAEWDGRDDRGQAVASGVYVVRLQTASQQRATKILLLK